jgi:hypothetical protein
MWLFNFESTPDIKSVTFYYGPTLEYKYARGLRHFRTSHGRIHFAGAERADRGFNWMEGAVRTGNLVCLCLCSIVATLEID